MENSIYIQLLSAGVIAALVEGLFSIIIAVKKDSMLKNQAEKDRSFEMKKIQYQQLTDAYNVLIARLPEEMRVTHVFANSKIREIELQEDEIATELAHLGETVSKEEMILISHYNGYGYLLNEDQQEKINSIIEEHDEFAKKGNLKWIYTVAKFEDCYIGEIKSKLVELSKEGGK